MNTAVSLPSALAIRGRGPLTSNQDSATVPFQRWYNFKEAFAPQLVAGVVKSLKQPAKSVLDPFGGSGTTGLTCQFLGLHPTQIEVNPFLSDLAEAKLTSYDVEGLVTDRGRLADFLASGNKPRLGPSGPAGAPPTLVEPGVKGRWLFDRPIAQRIWQYRQFIDSLENPSHARLFRVLLGSVLVPVSNVTISGKGRRYRKNWRVRRPHPQEVDHLFDEAFTRALYDIWRYRDRPCLTYEVVCDDARLAVSQGDAVDLVITSPPYPNSFDYTDIYNLELWALGYLRSKGDNRTLREATVRSHVQIKRPFTSGGTRSHLLEETIRELEQLQDRLWDKDIPAMVGAYFADLAAVLAGIRTRLSPSGTLAMVVGDSRYANVRIDVAGIIAETAVDSGFDLISKTPVRSMRSSPQHGGRFDLTETLLQLVPA